MRAPVIYALAALVATCSFAAIDPESAIGIWLFDEGSGDTAADSTGNGNDGELVDATWGDGVRDSKGVEFDGVAHVAFPANAMMDDYLDGFTYMLWVDVVAAPNGNTRIMERDWHNPTIQAGAGDFYGSIVTGAANIDNGIRGGAHAPGQFVHVALTHDGSTLMLYVEGEAVAESQVDEPTLTNANDDGAIWLGQWKAVGWDLTGRVDEVAVFNEPLEQGDIQELMTDGFEGFLAVEARGKLAMSWGRLKASTR
ncbi:LamG domain-containing protein [Candidatus Poribacteria bacterium]|jgi:hypothetical protein|nr:LamG domain-containing protein [Candidatus Poribacteria bacterium]MBT5534252.1 LamG domain-containing protein [Candidatus Poribacteria bacterium]MBT5712151.1 LamG domain-containing protein [Candidatus Poribacteria bacterium]MBT7100149.1 LamG domain-containing protein [Candidatus Poribacteria bacterium]MBT7809201.1 LamG domain-containing protein [Candidatus Poribacteria bacterium]